jgi:hypothetical protein
MCYDSASWATEVEYTSGISFYLKYRGQRFREKDKMTWHRGCQVEVGTSIRITHRNIAKSIIIQLYYCVFQYDRKLKAVR